MCAGMDVDNYLFVQRYLEQRECSEMYSDKRQCSTEGRPVTEVLILNSQFTQMTKTWIFSLTSSGIYAAKHHTEI